MDNYQATVDRMSVVRRFLIPVQSDDPIPGRPRCWGLAPDDFELVVAGHACTSCLACWAPAVLDTCPVCGEQRDTGKNIVERPDWADFEKHRQHEYENPTRTVNPPPMHEMIDIVSAEALEGHVPGKKKNF